MAAMLPEMEPNRLWMRLLRKFSLNDATELQMCGVFPLSGHEFPLFDAVLFSFHDKGSDSRVSILCCGLFSSKWAKKA